MTRKKHVGKVKDFFLIKKKNKKLKYQKYNL